MGYDDFVMSLYLLELRITYTNPLVPNCLPLSFCVLALEGIKFFVVKNYFVSVRGCMDDNTYRHI